MNSLRWHGDRGAEVEPKISLGSLNLCYNSTFQPKSDLPAFPQKDFLPEGDYASIELGDQHLLRAGDSQNYTLKISNNCTGVADFRILYIRFWLPYSSEGNALRLVPTDKFYRIYIEDGMPFVVVSEYSEETVLWAGRRTRA